MGLYLLNGPIRLDDHDVEVEDELRRGRGEGVEEPQHADVALHLVEPLVVDVVAGLHGLDARLQHFQVAETGVNVLNFGNIFAKKNWRKNWLFGSSYKKSLMKMDHNFLKSTHSPKIVIIILASVRSRYWQYIFSM
jgi:hypothetical protein